MSEGWTTSNVWDCATDSQRRYLRSLNDDEYRSVMRSILYDIEDSDDIFSAIENAIGK